jgi:hypothetical protein
MDDAVADFVVDSTRAKAGVKKRRHRVQAEAEQHGWMRGCDQSHLRN